MKIKLLLILIISFPFFNTISYSQNYQLSIFENIINGDFSQGNTGFFTDGVYSVDDLITEGNYTITSNPNAIYDVLAACSDHTPGTDSLMLVINGHYFPNMVVWGDSILNVIPNHDYLFSFWGASCNYRRPQAKLEIYINGQKLPTMMNLSDTICLWYEKEFVWNSDTNKIAVITIIDTILEVTGNDYAIDDLSFRAICTVEADAGQDVTICQGDIIQIGNNAPDGVPPFQYSWQPASGLNDPSLATPIVNANTTTTYYLTVTDSLQCVAYDTVSVTVIPFPQNKIITDKPTTICPCDSVNLTAPHGDSYLWSTGETSQSIYAKLPGNYRVNVNNQNLCSIDIDTQLVVLNLAVATTIQLDTVFADIGDNLIIPMHVVSPVNQNCPLGQFEATISYNKSLLVPTGNTPPGSVIGNEEIINISGTAQGLFLNNFEFIAVLGNAECTDIKLTNFKWDCDLLKVDTIYGRFCLRNLCREPIVRLFDDTGALFLSQARPNPATEVFKIDYGIIEEGITSLELYNKFGQKITELLRQNFKPGQYSQEFNVNKFESGSYFIKLQTPHNSLFKTIQIIH